MMQFSKKTFWHLSFYLFLLSSLTINPTVARGTPAHSQGENSTDTNIISQSGTILQPGQLLNGRISAGQTNFYSVNLDSGQYLSLVIEQPEIDLVIRVFDPAGELIGEVDKTYAPEPESLWLISGTTGNYRVDIQPFDSAKSGNYTIKVTELRAATEQELIQLNAQQIVNAAEELSEQGTVDSLQNAIAKYQEALEIYRNTGDRRMEANTLHAIGLLYYRLQEKPQALEYYTQSLSIWRELNSSAAEAGMLWSIGGVYSDLSEPQLALESYQSAFTIFEAVGDRAMAAQSLVSIARVYDKLGETQKALDSYNQALTLQQTEENLSEIANTYQEIGMLYISKGENQKGLEYLNQAIETYQQASDRNGEARARLVLGTVNYARGETQAAFTNLNQSLELFRADSDRYGEASALQSLGYFYSVNGEREKALESYQQALVILQETGNRWASAQNLSTLALIYESNGDSQQALDLRNQALKLQQEIGDRAGEAESLTNIGSLYSDRGEKQQALDNFEKALEIQREIGDRDGEADTLSEMAAVYESLGNYPLSLDAYNQVLSIFTELENRQGEAQTLESIATIYSLLEDYPQAIASANQALSSWETQGNPLGKVASLTTLVRIYEAAKDYPQALNSANQIVTIARQTNTRHELAAGLAMTGRIYRLMEEYQKALAALNEALPLIRTGGYSIAEAPVQINLGHVYSALKDWQKAIASYNQALSLYRGTNDVAGETDTLYNIARVERDRGNLEESLKQIQAAIEIIESLRSKVARQELRTSYFASVQKYYEFYIDLLMQLHSANPSASYNIKALEVSERARARSLLEILTEANTDIRTGVDPSLLEQENRLQQQLNTKAEKQQELLSTETSNPEEIANLQTEIQDILNQLQQVSSEIRRKSPRYAALTQPQPLTLSEIQQQVLSEDTLLLEYFLGEERSYVWAVTKTGISSYELPKRAEIEAKAKEFLDALTAPSLRVRQQKVNDLGTALSQLILQPVAAELGNKRLLIVSDRILQYIPFAALPTPQSSSPNPVPLIAEREIVNLPSASTLAVLRREIGQRPNAAKLLAVLADPVFSRNDERVQQTNNSAQNSPSPNGNSAQPNLINAQATLQRSAEEIGINLTRLPFTRTEAEQILALVPESEREQALGFAANRAIATSTELSQYQIVHFATHGILNSTNPELSGVVLSLVDERGNPQNGFLRLHDIYNLNLPAELVVLSACQTGLGEDIRGEGLIGLTRGFMYAGAERVIVSLWSVDDRATAELMTRFYRNLLQAGKTPAAALRAAQVEMSQETQWKAPYYWAGFTLQGEWQ